MMDLGPVMMTVEVSITPAKPTVPVVEVVEVVEIGT